SGTQSAVATAAMPSPRPVRPSPSDVVAETLTGAPTTPPRTFSASALRGENLGRLLMIWIETLPTAKPAARTRATVSASRDAPEAPFHRGSDVPKLDPRSPNPHADSRASQAAWAATSPSEWPLTPS